MLLKFAKLRLLQKLLLTRFGAQIGRATNFRTFRASVLSAHGVESSSPNALSDKDVQHLWENVTIQNGQKKSHLTIRYLNDRRRFEQSRWLPALSVAGQQTPVHLCWGDADQVARIEMAHHLKNSICPQARLSVMPGVGHFCQLGSPQTWLEKVMPFYDELPR
jgi:pimeloyl-ACP methyl ester carboxylesterase